jgi:hypothetical protein
VLHAFVYNDTAILVRHWFEISLKDSHLEHGVRLELRLREPQPHQGTESAGGFDAAHFHPRFTGPEPCERNWAAEIKETPWEWLHGQLGDIAAVAETAGVPLPDPAPDTEQIRADAAEIVAVARSRAAVQCGSVEQCFAWTQDAAPIVQLMLDQLRQPELLDRDRVSPWLTAEPAPIVHLMLDGLKQPDLLDRDRAAPWLKTWPAA